MPRRWANITYNKCDALMAYFTTFVYRLGCIILVDTLLVAWAGKELRVILLLAVSYLFFPSFYHDHILNQIIQILFFSFKRIV